MKKSLLGHLYSHIKGSAEDVATMSLQYLLTYYDELNVSFNELAASKLETEYDKNTSYTCQSVGEELERPDMSGTDSNGHEVILVEVKFYAGLTFNQPLTYLKRLKEENGVGLVFVCPKDRVISLWDTLYLKCKDTVIDKISEQCVSVDGIRMTVLSWQEIIFNLTQTANAVAKDALSDIEQLKGYCEQIMSDSFVPFRAEDLGASEAKKIERLMYIVDRVIDALAADKELSADERGLRMAPHRHGYRRFIKIDGLCVTIHLDLETWADDRYIDTPYWIYIQNSEWKTPAEFKDRVSSMPSSQKRIADKDIYLAVEVPCNVLEDGVVESIKNQIIEYVQLFK